jgi:hypothetical protein
MATADRSGGPSPESLYSHLAEPAPVTAPTGETTFTAAKETIDRDREALDEMALPSES